jgi:hypothetical protein
MSILPNTMKVIGEAGQVTTLWEITTHAKKSYIINAYEQYNIETLNQKRYS